MNAVQTGRSPAAPVVTAPEPNTRQRQSATEPGGDSFEQMLSPKPAPAEGDGAVVTAPQPQPITTGASMIALPQALAEMLRGAMQTTPDSDGDDAKKDDDTGAAPAPVTTLQQAFALFTPAPTEPRATTTAPAAQTTTAPPAPQAVVSQTPLDGAAPGADGEGDVVATKTAPTPEARPERSSIMTALDQAVQTPRHGGAQDRGGSHDGAAPSVRVEAEAVDAAPATDGGVKVSFVSMSRSPAPVVAPAEAAPVERAQAVTPPAPPPPPPAAAQHLRLVMEPAGLGAVALNLSLSDARVSVDLEAQRSETRHKLEAGRDQLVDSLTGAGYDVAQVQVKTASTEAGFDPARRDGAAANDAPSERAHQQRDERARGQDQETRTGDHADDPRARPHRGGGVFI